MADQDASPPTSAADTTSARVRGRLKRLNAYYRPYIGTYILGTVFLTLSNFFLVWIPVLIRTTMDEVEALRDLDAYEGFPVAEVLLSGDAGRILAANASILILSVLLYGVFLFATRQTLIVGSRKIEFDLRSDFMDKLVRLPQAFFARNKTGDIYVRGTEDIAKVREYFGPVFMYNVNTLTKIGFVMAMMLLVNTELTLWALLPLPFLSVFAYVISQMIHTYQTRIQEQYSTMAGLVQESFSSIRLIKAFTRESYELERFDAEARDYRARKLKLDLVESLFHPTLNLMIGLSVVIVVWKGGAMVIDGLISVGNIAEFIIYVAYLTWPVASLGYTLNVLQKSLASWDRLTAFFDEPLDIDAPSDAWNPDHVRGDIRFDHVTFSYPGTDALALNDVSIHIPAGSKVGIIGRTGCGKTSLVQLMPRLFDTTEGTVSIDGIDVKRWDPCALRRSIGYVPQESFLFSATVGVNIAFGVEHPSEDDIMQAAESASVLDNILDFDDGFDTLTGERGITLSGGQKQRVSIARALIKQPPIIIFDDSLSAVDTRTESEIIQHLRSRLSHTTVVTISHRISTIQQSDIIYVLDQGRVSEFGTHDDLIANEGIYASMFRKQLIEKELEDIR